MAERSNGEVIAHLIATAQPRTEKVRVCARGDLVDQHALLVAQIDDAVKDAKGASIAGGDSPEIGRLHDEIHAVQEEQESATTEFTLRSVGSLAWANLLRAHLPRPGRDHRLAFNLETFPPAAVAACVVSPPITLEQAIQLYGTDETPGVLHSAEWDKLFSAAYVLNEVETPHPKLPAAIDGLLRSGRSSTTSVNAASLAPSSSDASEGP